MASSFVEALLHGRLPIVMEVKRSDGEGAELMGDRTIPEIVEQYVAVGANHPSAIPQSSGWRAVHLGGHRPLVRR